MPCGKRGRATPIGGDGRAEALATMDRMDTMDTMDTVDSPEERRCFA